MNNISQVLLVTRFGDNGREIVIRAKSRLGARKCMIIPENQISDELKKDIFSFLYYETWPPKYTKSQSEAKSIGISKLNKLD